MVSLERVAALGCIVCRRIYLYYEDHICPAEIHHLRTGVGMAQKSDKVIPLCPHHHRHGGHGQAFHAGKRKWESKFGTEMELWEATQELLT